LFGVSSRAVDSGEFAAEFSADPAWVVDQRSGDEVDHRLRHEAQRRLLAAGAGASGRDDISERIEAILANEVQPSH